MPPHTGPTPHLLSLQVFGACFFGQRTLVVIEGSVGREQFVKYLARHPHHVGAWTQVCPLHSCAAPLSHLAHTLPHLLQPHSSAELRRSTAPPQCRAHPLRAASSPARPPWTQATLNALGISLDFITNIKSTNGGAVVEVYIHGFSTLVVLRPSTGSTVFSAYVKGGPQAAMLLLASFHNQMVAVGR